MCDVRRLWVIQRPWRRWHTHAGFVACEGAKQATLSPPPAAAAAAPVDSIMPSAQPPVTVAAPEDVPTTAANGLEMADAAAAGAPHGSPDSAVTVGPPAGTAPDMVSESPPDMSAEAEREERAADAATPEPAEPEESAAVDTEAEVKAGSLSEPPEAAEDSQRVTGAPSEPLAPPQEASTKESGDQEQQTDEEEPPSDAVRASEASPAVPAGARPAEQADESAVHAAAAPAALFVPDADPAAEPEPFILSTEVPSGAAGQAPDGASATEATLPAALQPAEAPLTPGQTPLDGSLTADNASAAARGDVDGEQGITTVDAVPQPAAAQGEAPSIAAADPAVTSALGQAQQPAASTMLAETEDTDGVAMAGATGAATDAKADDGAKDPAEFAVSSDHPSGDNFADAHSSQGEDGFHDAEEGQSKAPTPAGASPTASES